MGGQPVYHGWSEVARSPPVCARNMCRFSLGDCQDLFSLQSTSKPFTYALSLDHLGAEVGQPTLTVNKYIYIYLFETLSLCMTDFGDDKTFGDIDFSFVFPTAKF